MNSRDANLTLVRAFWDDLYRRDYTALAARFTSDALYQDVPVPAGDVVGPEAIIRKLRVGFDRVGRHEHEIRRILADHTSVMTEHTEVWHFDAEHTATLPFVTVHEIRDGRIALWRDYWNFETLMSGAPEWWIEHIAAAWAEQETPA